MEVGTAQTKEVEPETAMVEEPGMIRAPIPAPSICQRKQRFSGLIWAGAGKKYAGLGGARTGPTVRTWPSAPQTATSTRTMLGAIAVAAEMLSLPLHRSRPVGYLAMENMKRHSIRPPKSKIFRVCFFSRLAGFNNNINIIPGRVHTLGSWVLLTVNYTCRAAARFCTAGRCPRPWRPPEGQMDFM